MEHVADLLIESFSDASRFLLAWSWETFLLLGFVCLMLRFGRIRTPAVRHLIWLFGLFIVAVFPILLSIPKDLTLELQTNAGIVSIVEMPSKITGPAITGVPAISPTYHDGNIRSNERTSVLPTSLNWLSGLLSFLFAAWLMGAIVTIVRLGRSFLKIQGIVRRAELTTATDLECDEIRLGDIGSSRVQIGLSSEVTSPVLAGLLQPIILLPLDIKDWTTSEDRVSILDHELSHVIRRDHYSNFFQSLLGSIFFFHPLFSYACGQANLERELACDAWVLERGAAPDAYADSILKIVERNIFPDVFPEMPSFATRKTLERRIEMILKRNHIPVLNRHWHLLVVPMGLIAVLAWMLIPQRDVTAQKNVEPFIPSAKTTAVRDVHSNSPTATDDDKMIDALAQAKAFDQLAQIVREPSDSARRRHALQALADLEADGVDGTLISLYNEPNDADLRRMLIQFMGDRKLLDKLVRIAKKDPDPELRRLAVERLTDLEGDGVSQALVNLYNTSADTSVKEMLLKNLGERNEYELLQKTSAKEADAGLRTLAVKLIAGIDANSDSKDR